MKHRNEELYNWVPSTKTNDEIVGRNNGSVEGCYSEDLYNDTKFGSALGVDYIEPINKIRDGDGDSYVLQQIPHVVPGIALEKKKKGSKLFGNSLIYSGKGMITFESCANSHLEGVDMMQRMKARLRLDEFVHLGFISASAEELILIVNLSSSLEYHNVAYNQVAKYFFDEYVLVDDGSGADVFCKCHLSLDGDPIFNPKSETFKIKLPK